MNRLVHIAILAAIPALAGPFGCTTTDGGQPGMRISALFAPRTSGEQWTILCIELMQETPNRRQTIDQLADALRRSPGLDPQAVRTNYDANASGVYYGSFKPETRDGNVHFQNADRALVQHLRSLAIGSSHPFLEARLVPVPTPDVGPPEWNVRNCPNPYTLHIAEFYNTGGFDQRKEVAVQYCGMLREKGYEAYYWHGPRRSFVSVGSLRRDRDFMIRPDGIMLSLKWRELVDSDPELKYKTVNGRFVVMRILDKSNRQQTLPIACPDRPRPSDEEWLRQRKLRPLHR